MRDRSVQSVNRDRSDQRAMASPSDYRVKSDRARLLSLKSLPRPLRLEDVDIFPRSLRKKTDRYDCLRSFRTNTLDYNQDQSRDLLFAV